MKVFIVAFGTAATIWDDISYDR